MTPVDNFLLFLWYNKSILNSLLHLFILRRTGRLILVNILVLILLNNKIKQEA
jgi:hypothetical protein